MISKQEKDLIHSLGELGFQGRNLQTTFHWQLDSDLPNFAIVHLIDYETERIVYGLKFQKDYRFDTYRLEEYKTTFYKEIGINQQVINCINTWPFEGRLKVIDWDIHFSHINTRLVRLFLTFGDWIYTGVGRAAKYKRHSRLNSPPSIYDNHLKEVGKSYDTSRSFSPTENEWVKAHLAYHILSSRLGDLHKELTQTGVEKYPGVDLDNTVVRQLSGNSNNFSIKCVRAEREFYIDITVPIIKIEGGYSLDTYTASPIPYPPIQHGIYQSIDTTKLESQMKEIDWRKDKQLFIIQEDIEPALTPAVAQIQEQMHQLSQEQAGAVVTDSLMLRYWPETTFFEDLIPERTWDYLDALPKRVKQSSVEIEAKTAFNLLCGRAILTAPREVQSLDKGEWIQICPEKEEEKQPFANPN